MTPTWKQAYIKSGSLYLERIDSANVWTLDETKAARFPLNASEHRPDFVDHIAAAVLGEVTPCAPWPKEA